MTDDELTDELLDMFNLLSDEQKNDFLNIVKFIIELQTCIQNNQ